MIYTISVEWKTFAVELADLDRWLHASVPNYIGMSANSCFEIHMSEAPSDDVRARIEQYWNSLTEQSESNKIAARNRLNRVVAYAKDNLPYVDFLQMIPAEKKLFMGRDLSLQDKEDLAAKYPNI